MSDICPYEVPVPPAYYWVPERYGSYGQEIIDLCEMAGMTFDAEQKLAIDAMASHDRQGKWTAGEVLIKEPRQNGKTNRVLVPLTLADMYLFKPGLILHSAHLFRTANETFDELVGIINGCFELRRRVKRVLRSTHEQSIELLNGTQVYFVARSGSAARGLSGKRINLDEAFALQGVQLGAMLPILLAKENTQITYATSAAKKDSSALHELNRRGRVHHHTDECVGTNDEDACSLNENSGDPGLVFIEWKADGDWKHPGCERGKLCNHHWSTIGCALDREENIRKANHAIQYGRITLAKIRTMRTSLPAGEFGREILGWDDIEEVVEVIPIEPFAWARCKDESSEIIGPITIAFEIAPNKKTACIAVCGYNQHGAKHVEITHYKPGSDWVIDTLVAMKNEYELFAIRLGEKKKGNRRRPAIICDPSSASASLLPSLKNAGIDPILIEARNLGIACGGLQDDVIKGPDKIVHIGQSQIDSAIEGAVKRDVGDGGWAFSRKRSADVQVDIIPLSAIALARWGITVASQPLAEPRAAWG